MRAAHEKHVATPKILSARAAARTEQQQGLPQHTEVGHGQTTRQQYENAHTDVAAAAAERPYRQHLATYLRADGSLRRWHCC